MIYEMGFIEAPNTLNCKSFKRTYMSSDLKGEYYLLVKESRVHFDFLKGYYQTGLLAVLSSQLSRDEIISALGAALSTVFGERKFGSEGELRDRLLDLLYTKTKLATTDIEKGAKAVIRKSYNYFWGFPKEAKRAIALLQAVEHYPGLLERLDSYSKRLRSREDASTAEAIERMYWIIERHYLLLHKNKLESRNHLHNF